MLVFTFKVEYRKTGFFFVSKNSYLMPQKILCWHEREIKWIFLLSQDNKWWESRKKHETYVFVRICLCLYSPRPFFLQKKIIFLKLTHTVFNRISDCFLLFSLITLQIFSFGKHYSMTYKVTRIYFFMWTCWNKYYSDSFFFNKSKR